MKKINRTTRLLFLGFVAVSLVAQPAHMFGQFQLGQRVSQLRGTAAQSFEDFSRYFKQRFPAVAAAPSQMKAIWEVGVRKWRGEQVSPELSQAAWKGLGYTTVVAILTAMASYFAYQKVVKPWKAQRKEAELKAAASGKSLWDAVRAGDEELARYMIGKGANVNLRSKEEYYHNATLLYRAVEVKNVPAVTLLLKLGATPDIPETYYLRAPLHLAVQEGNVELIKLLLENKADPNIKGFAGDTPLHWAVRWADEIEKKAPGTLARVMKLLVEYGADLNAKNNNNMTPLEWTKTQFAPPQKAEVSRKILEALEREQPAAQRAP